jgi:ubiquinone biosynthesis protein UbiJ
MLLAATTLNHVLAQNAWAMQRLAPLAGKTFALQAAPLPAITFTIQADGQVKSAAPGAPAAATLSATPDALLRYFTVAPHDPNLIRILGDHALGAEIGHVLAHISWEAEEDLSRLFGDVIAHRLFGFARHWVEWRKQSALSLVTAASEYFTEERPLIAKRSRIAQFAQDVDAVRNATDLLESRIKTLSNRPDAQ